MSSNQQKSGTSASRGPANGSSRPPAHGPSNASNDAGSTSYTYDDLSPPPTEALPTYLTAVQQGPPPYTSQDTAPQGSIPLSAMVPFENQDLSPALRPGAGNINPMGLTDAEINALTSIDLLDRYIDVVSARAFFEGRATTVQEATVLAKLRYQRRRCLEGARS